MTPADRERFPPQAALLRNGLAVVIRLLAKTDGEALAGFYAGIPAEDAFFYCPHPLTRECAFENSARADSPVEVVLVLESPGSGIGGYAWYRWKQEDIISGFGICIARPLQGAGAGQQLVSRLLEIAGTVGPPAMSLTVQKKNPKGVELYVRTGFRIIREQSRARDGEPEFYMERPVR